ncbi:lycopene cyclase domain-containing protein [Agromyces seonyuensis]|uniref:Lycopene cyclase domain-containing protein n=1 Tax=Agromyces seonyuensis TaxID=2662446 RepID=A0A6I4NV32_9MICO|nr:lycopene cyclase domain-containing protein [Agromyces seonyuensis]MWB98238.1 lycopene cyclase domain-containing protein [Agromyces seonyuensis]
MTGILISLPFLAIAAIVFALERWRDRRLRPEDAARRRRRATAILLAALALVVLTTVFDSLMVAAALTDYRPEAVTGLRLWLAPIEDFLYPIAGVLLLPAVFDLLRRRAPAVAVDVAESASGERG